MYFNGVAKLIFIYFFSENPLSDTHKKLLYKHGAILLQGFPLGEAKQYNTFLKYLDGVKQLFYSQAGGVRHSVEERVSYLEHLSNDWQ